MSTLRTLEQFSPNTWRLGKFPFRRFGFGADSIPMIKGRVTILLKSIWIIGHLYNRKIINSWLMTTYSISLSEESLRFILGKFHTAPGPIFCHILIQKSDDDDGESFTPPLVGQQPWDIPAQEPEHQPQVSPVKVFCFVLNAKSFFCFWNIGHSVYENSVIFI